LSEEFRFATFFPGPLQPAIDMLAAACTCVTGLGGSTGSTQPQAAWFVHTTGTHPGQVQAVADGGAPAAGSWDVAAAARAAAAAIAKRIGGADSLRANASAQHVPQQPSQQQWGSEAAQQWGQQPPPPQQQQQQWAAAAGRRRHSSQGSSLQWRLILGRCARQLLFSCSSGSPVWQPL
jgi:hypothetical protein